MEKTQIVDLETGELLTEWDSDEFINTSKTTRIIVTTVKPGEKVTRSEYIAERDNKLYHVRP